MLQFRAGLFRRRGPRCEVDRAILCGDLASHCQDRPCPGGKFRGDDSERVGLALDHLRGTIFAVEGIRERLLKRSFTNESRGHPYARRPGSLQNFNARCYLKSAPTIKSGDLRKQTLSLREHDAHQYNATSLHNIATL